MQRARSDAMTVGIKPTKVRGAQQEERARAARNLDRKPRSHKHGASRGARAVRAKCSFAGF